MSADDLVARLARKELGRTNFDGVLAGAYHEMLVNPDGPEAAQVISTLTEALEEAREALALGAAVPLPDPRCSVVVKALGEQIGFGAMMATASLEWRKVLGGELAGGEFCAGPCRSTAENVIAQIDAALSKVAGDAK